MKLAGRCGCGHDHPLRPGGGHPAGGVGRRHATTHPPKPAPVSRAPYAPAARSSSASLSSCGVDTPKSSRRLAWPSSSSRPAPVPSRGRAALPPSRPPAGSRTPRGGRPDRRPPARDSRRAAIPGPAARPPARTPPAARRRRCLPAAGAGRSRPPPPPPRARSAPVRRPGCGSRSAGLPRAGRRARPSRSINPQGTPVASVSARRQASANSGTERLQAAASHRAARARPRPPRWKPGRRRWGRSRSAPHRRRSPASPASPAPPPWPPPARRGQGRPASARAPARRNEAGRQPALAVDRHRQHQSVVVVGVLADQVDAPGGAHPIGLRAGAESGTQLVWRCAHPVHANALCEAGAGSASVSGVPIKAGRPGSMQVSAQFPVTWSRLHADRSLAVEVRRTAQDVDLRTHRLIGERAFAHEASAGRRKPA